MAQTLHFTLPESQFGPGDRQLIAKRTPWAARATNLAWRITSGGNGRAVPFKFCEYDDGRLSAPLTQAPFLQQSRWLATDHQHMDRKPDEPEDSKPLAAGQHQFPFGTSFDKRVYFKAGWQSPFNPTLTRSETFDLSSGSLESVPMMHQERTFDTRHSRTIRCSTCPTRRRHFELQYFQPNEQPDQRRELAKCTDSNAGRKPAYHDVSASGLAEIYDDESIRPGYNVGDAWGCRQHSTSTAQTSAVSVRPRPSSRQRPWFTRHSLALTSKELRRPGPPL